MPTPCEKKVEDIMVPIYDFPTVSGEASLKDAIRVLMNSYTSENNKPRTGRQCLFVVDNNELVGLFGIHELLTAIEPVYVKGAPTSSGYMPHSILALPLFWSGLFNERCQEISDIKVIDFMRPIERYVDINDSLLKVAYTLVEQKADAVAVKKNNRLAGMVRSVDLFREISNQIFDPEPSTAKRDAYCNSRPA